MVLMQSTGQYLDIEHDDRFRIFPCRKDSTQGFEKHEWISKANLIAMMLTCYLAVNYTTQILEVPTTFFSW